MTSLFQEDLKRWYGRRETIKERLLRPVQLKYLYHLRKINETHGVLRAFHQMRLRYYSVKSGLQISHRAHIGGGLYVPHFGAIVVGEDSVLGKNITLGMNCVIGRENRGTRQGSPTVGDCVWIGAGSVLCGKITIGTDVVIAPGAFVNFDVPPHSIVVGNPGVIHPKDNATADYITRMV